MFEIDQLPYQEMAVLGLTRESLLKLPAIEQKNLLSGERSNLTRFTNIHLNDTFIEALDAKISFQRNENGEANLVIHPIQKEAHNLFQLSDREVKDLISGKIPFVNKDLIDKTSEYKQFLVKYDKDLNDFYVKSQSIQSKQETVPIKGRKKEEEWPPLNDIKPTSNYEILKGFVGNVFLFALDGGLTMAVKALMKNQQEEKELKNNKLANGVITTPAVTIASSGIPVAKDLGIPATGITLPAQTQGSVHSTKGGNTLVNHGEAPYQFTENNKPSYFVTLQIGKGEQTVWGVDLKRAIQESQVAIGDKIAISNLGNNPVKIIQDKHDEEGRVVGTETIESKRNKWSVELIAKGQPKDELQQEPKRVSKIDEEASAHTSANMTEENGMDYTRKMGR